MANTTQWTTPSGWTDTGITLTGFNSLASGSWVLGSAISVTLDLYADYSFSVKVGGTTVAGDYIGVYILPLNEDGSTYGDGSSAGSTLPVAGYLVGTIGVAAGITSGNVITGTVRGIILPTQNYKWGVANRTSVALNSTASATSKYTTYDENLNH
jgi:hypothetical protein